MIKKNTNVDVKETGNRIKRIMKEKGVTCSQLAQILGVTSSAVSNYRNGRNLPNTEDMNELCKCLYVNITDLVVDMPDEKE